jgi:hypothetical protein
MYKPDWGVALLVVGDTWFWLKETKNNVKSFLKITIYVDVTTCS